MGILIETEIQRGIKRASEEEGEIGFCNWKIRMVGKAWKLEKKKL